jgi:antitoxin HigA-1
LERVPSVRIGPLGGARRGGKTARRMDISRPALYAVLNGTGAVTPQMASRFMRLVKGGPDLYVQMQVRRDLWLAGQRRKDQLERIEPAV